jgi:hypothetical protein
MIRKFSLGLIFYVSVICSGHFYAVFPDGAFRIELTHHIVTEGSLVTSVGPVKYAPLQSLIMAPFYAAGYYFGVMTDAASQNLQKIGDLFTFYLFLPIVISSLCVVYFGIIKKMGVDDNVSLLSTFLLFWATFLLPYGGGLYSEPLSALLLLISFYYFYTAPATSYVSNNRKNFLCLGLLILNGFIFVVYFALMMAYVIWASRVRRNDSSEAWRVTLEGSLILMVSVAMFLSYNYYRYGEFFNFGYQGEGFTGNWLVGMYGLMFSSGKGLLVFSPLTLLCILYFILKNHQMESWQRYVVGTSLISFVCYWLIYSRWDAWHGGMCWGPRFLLPFVPLIHLMFPMLLKSISSGNKAFRVGLVLAVAWAVGVNLLNYLDPFASVPSDAMTVTAKEFGQRFLIPEESVVFKVWNIGILSWESLKFLAVLGLCASSLWFWKKKFSDKLSVPELSVSEAS